MISVEKLTIQQGEFRIAGVSFDVPSGCFAALMGKTGSGKTSLLEAVCGLRKVDSGSITLCGRDVTNLRPSERGIGYVPQDGALFETMSVREHLAFACRLRKWEKSKIDDRVREIADLLEIRKLLDRKPKGLSGGEVQRVALGRALSFEPEVLLLDEPLSALDDATREQMYDVIARVHEHAGTTALHVTHNRAEAEVLSDCILTLSDGSITIAENKRKARTT